MLTLRELLALRAMPGMRHGVLCRLSSSIDSFDLLVRLNQDELARHGLKGTTIRALGRPAPYFDVADEELATCGRLGVRLVPFADSAYPPLLREIWSPPPVLYWWGATQPEDIQGISVVGTRTCSTYGMIATERYARTFAQAGVTIVSGLARGIDTYAHQGALRHGGSTVAVVASGLDQIQPAMARRLAADIRGNGAIVTEYPFGTRATKTHFPQRNRIISGMTRAVVVVESDLKGGALITAKFALDQNREVFAIPGPINSNASNGTNDLIRTDRARLTFDPVDVLDALGYHVPQPDGAESGSAHELSAFEQKILESMDGDPRQIDEICELTGFGPSELLVSLLSLEFKGLVRQMAGKIFVKV